MRVCLFKSSSQPTSSFLSSIAGAMALHILARLLSLSAASYQLAAALHGYFWPKVFWDFATKALDPLVRPVPVLQTANLLNALAVLFWEWPHHVALRLPWHQSHYSHIMGLLLASIPAILLYQGTNAAIYYVIAAFVFARASRGEPEPPDLRTGRRSRLGHPFFTPVGRPRGILGGRPQGPISRLYNAASRPNFVACNLKPNTITQSNAGSHHGSPTDYN